MKASTDIKNPKLSFSFGKTELDIVALKILWFKDQSLWKELSQKYPAFFNVRQWDQEKVGRILESIYQEQSKELSLAREKFHLSWDKIQEDWFSFLNSFFNFESGLPDAFFRAYLGVSPISPRKISEESFLVNFEKSEREMRITCAHETSHFYFYRGLAEWLNKTRKCSDRIIGSNHVWLLSEILVPLLFNDEASICLLGRTPLESYVCKPSLIKKFMAFYERKKGGKIGIEDFFNEILQFSIDKDELNLKFLE
jgi:hypothetical protein